MVTSLDGDPVVVSAVAVGRPETEFVDMLKNSADEVRVDASNVVGVFVVVEFPVPKVLGAVRVTLVGVEVGTCVLSREDELDPMLL